MTTLGDATTTPPESTAPPDPPATSPTQAVPRPPDVDDFLGESTRDLEAWRWLWTVDRQFPVRSHRGLLGRLLVAGKRLLRPIVRGATADLWDRQRSWNLIVIEHLAEMRRIEEDLVARMAPVEHKAAHLEAFLQEGLRELMRYDDALYSRVDQKLDRYRREAGDLTALLGAAVERAAAGGGAPALATAMADRHYLELERRHRGTPAEIRARRPSARDRPRRPRRRRSRARAPGQPVA